MSQLVQTSDRNKIKKLSRVSRGLLLFCLFCLSALSLDSRGDDKILLVAGGDQKAVELPAMEAALHEPFGTAFDPANDLWIVEMASGNRLLKVNRDGSLSHLAGRSEKGFRGDGGPALDAQFNGPHNLAIRPDGKILIADTWNGVIRQVDPQSRLVESLSGFSVPIDKAKNSGAYCITMDFSGNFLFIANLQQVLRLDLLSGKSIVIAGNGSKGVPTNGALAVNAPLSDPRAVAPDRLGNVYILERSGNALRVVKQDGTIETVVNESGKAGTARDAGKHRNSPTGSEIAEVEPALGAMMRGPKHLCVDLMNRVIIADAENHLIRRYDPDDRTVRRIAGTGESGREGLGGSPLKCMLARPHGVTIHSKTGELYITDSYNNRILRIASEQK